MPSSISKSFFTLAILTCSLCVAQTSQEEDEVLREFDQELREVEQRKVMLKERIRRLDARAELFREGRKLRTEIIELERKIEQAEDDDDDERLEQLDEKIGLRELGLEEVHAKLELHHRRVDLDETIAELREAGLEAELKQADALVAIHREATATVSSLFKVFREAPESEEGQLLEEELDSLEHAFEQRFDSLRLKLELHWAREEEDLEAIEEIEAELELLRKVKELPDVKDQAKEMPEPIRLTDEEVVAYGQLSFPDEIVPLLQTHCFGCHDSSSASGDLDLESLVRVQPLVVHRNDWVNVIQQLKVRSMPPADSEPVPEDSRRAMVGWLGNSIDNFDYTTVRSPGLEPARRLTHDEYNHSVRDLFGVDLRPADQFPVDLSASSGFDNSANSLFIQPVTMERYIGAAEMIVQEAIPAQSSEPNGSPVVRRLLRDGTARDAVIHFASRAFRRPLEDSERNELLAHFDQLTRSGLADEEALRQTLQVVLVSPSFLIRTERRPDATDTSHARVTPYELASRLSYFLWASMPDDRLFLRARDGSLLDHQVLKSEVKRMLQDDRADTLGTVFASQWLGFGDLARVHRDQIETPWATDSLFDAMHDESSMLFTSLVRSNAPIERLLDADFTFVNEELSRHYGLKNVEGPAMRRVSLQGTPRGGILGHASILSITSFPGRTSPVVRGNWILSTLLGTPPPPPPPNVSEFDDAVANSDALSQRQKLELHRQNPNCYACHSEIDPLGFALEQFQWYGRLRSGGRRGRQIDVTGMLPSGRQVEGLAGLREALVTERRGDIVRQVTRKMLSYALGRQLEYYDEATVREIIEQVEAENRGFQTLIHAIVASDAFQMKQSPTEERLP